MRFVFDMYAGDGLIDAVYVIDAIYGLKLNPTRSLVLTHTKTETPGILSTYCILQLQGVAPVILLGLHLSR